MKTLVVDGNNLLARADHAAKGGRTQMSVDGVNTSALLIFINLISKYVRQVNPTHLAVMWDHGHDLRDQISPDYKANRSKHVEEPEDVVTPWRQAKEFLTWAGVPHLARKGFEADDLIAMVAVRNSMRSTGSMVILSGDKDLLQLVDGVTTQIRPGGTGSETWDTDRVAEELHLLPAHIPMYMAMVGDTSDNVAGVRGIGPKKAVALLEKVGWEWEPLLAELGEEKAAQAVLGRRLVDLRYKEFAAWSIHWDYPLEVPKFIPTEPGSMLWPPLEQFLSQWQMNSVMHRLKDGSLWYTSPDSQAPDGTADAFSGFQV